MASSTRAIVTAGLALDDLEKDVDPVDGVSYTVELSPGERGRLLRKIDWNLLPLVTLLFLLSFLDRANIGNAKVAGLSTDLHLVGLRYNTAVAVFFVFYTLAEVPSNIILKLFLPSRWLPTIMVAWGLVTTLMCLVNTYQELIVVRVFLGLTEAGLFPGVNFYLSMWYPRADLATRIAIFYSAATLAGAFGGILSYAIQKMDGIGGLHGWQWIFCLEGLATVLVAFGSFFLMQDYPETATFLTEKERCKVVGLLKNDSHNLATHYNLQFVLQALKDYKTYLQSAVFIGLAVPVYAVALFTPTIINELGFSAANAQLLSVPPNIAGCICTILAGIYSDVHKVRGPYVIGGAFLSLVGYIVLYTQISPGASYTGAVLAAAGIYPTIPIYVAWIGSNAGGDMKRGVVIAVVIGVSNLGGICSSFIYFDPPRFHVGHGTNIGCLCFSILGSAFAMWNYNRLNKRKEKECREGGITVERKDEFRNMDGGYTRELVLVWRTRGAVFLSYLGIFGGVLCFDSGAQTAGGTEEQL